MAQAGAGASKITIEEEEPRLQQIQGVPTADTGVVGITERGPVGVATLITAHEEYVRIFGNDIANGNVSHAVRGFFAEGGQRMYVVRTVHYTNVDTPATKTSAAATRNIPTGATAPSAGTVLGSAAAPFLLASGDTLQVAIDGGGPATATFTGVAPFRETTGAGPYALSNAQTLTVSIDGGLVQTITFLTAEFVSIGAATRAEVAAVINAKITGAVATDTGTRVRITSDRKGTSGGVNVTGGSANAVLLFTTGNTAGTGNVANIAAVTVAEVKTIVEAAVAGSLVVDVAGKVRISSTTTGPSSSVAVQAGSTADDELGLDNATHSGATGAAVDTLTVDGRYDGAYANLISIRIAAATNGVAGEFDLQVLDDGRVTATFVNVSMDPAHPRYVVSVVNDETTGSYLVVVTDLGVSGTATERRPANGTYGPLTGGDDGLSGLVDADYIGSAAGKTGLYALDTVESLSLLIVPGAATSAVHNAMLSYCEVWRNMSVFAVLDIPAGLTAEQANTYVETTAAILESSEFGEIHWPRVKVLNPNTAVFGTAAQIVVPASGIICGVKARGDAVLGGVYQPAAGIERGIMRSVLGFETDEVLDERKRDLVFPKRINPLTTGDGLPRYIDGSRTLKSTGNFPYSSERRGVIFIEQSVKRGLQFARHSNNTPDLRARCDRSVRNFLRQEMKKKAFRSMDPDTAFFVDFGDGLNTDAVIFAGQLIGRIGLATNKPAEFIVLRLSQDTRALEAELAG